MFTNSSNILFGDIYKGKKVLVTGHTGFKGSWLCLWLVNLGAEVIGYALESETNPSLFNALGLENRMKSIYGDIRDEEHLFSVFYDHQPEIVFHLAAQPLVIRSYQETRSTYEINVIGTVNLLEAVKNTPCVKTVINITSDKCYENREWVYGYRENDPIGGFDPYSASKGAAELVTSSYRNSFFNIEQYGITHNISLASVRAGNVIGGGDWSQDRLIPDCVKALANGERIIIRNPFATRPWQHVLESLSGYLHLGAAMMLNPHEYAQAWNFGPDDNAVLNVENVVADVIETWGEGEYTVMPDVYFHEANLLKLDTSKASINLKWKGTYSAKKAIFETVDWYRHYYNGHSMHEYSLVQLNSYIKAAKEAEIIWSIDNYEKTFSEKTTRTAF